MTPLLHARHCILCHAPFVASDYDGPERPIEVEGYDVAHFSCAVDWRRNGSPQIRPRAVRRWDVGTKEAACAS